jgi:hypothetical protein
MFHLVKLEQQIAGSDLIHFKTKLGLSAAHVATYKESNSRPTLQRLRAANCDSSDNEIPRNYSSSPFSQNSRKWLYPEPVQSNIRDHFT